MNGKRNWGLKMLVSHVVCALHRLMRMLSANSAAGFVMSKIVTIRRYSRIANSQRRTLIRAVFWALTLHASEKIFAFFRDEA